jgi:hypothetical protein
MPMASGRAVVASGGTPVQLSTSSKACLSVTVTALSGNSGTIAVGGADVVAAIGTRKGTALEKGQTAKWTAEYDAVDDLNQVYIDAGTSGDGVSFAYTTRL